MRTAAYCRFSSDRQQDTSIRDQLRNIENYCKRAGWPTPALYQDQALSGARNDRPGYQTMLAAAEVGAFDVLLVDDLSRLSRDSIESAKAIRALKFAGIRVIGVSDGTDTSRDGYKLETGLRGLMSEFYLDDLAKKTHRGLVGKALDGFSAGGLPYGYHSHQVSGGFVRTIDEDAARWVRYIFEQYAAGVAPRKIAADLNAKGVPSPRGGTWAHSALYPDAKGVGILGNAIYNGRMVWNKTAWIKDPETGRRKRVLRPIGEWIIKDVPELKIIDDALWMACERRIKGVREASAIQKNAGKKAVGRAGQYLLSGILRCGECGGAYVIVSNGMYGCAAHKDRGNSVCANAMRVKRQKIEDLLLAEIRENLLSEDAYRAFEAKTRELLKGLRPDPAAAKKRLQSAQKELDNIMGAIKAGIFTSATKAALMDAEHRVDDAKKELQAVVSFEPTQILPRAREIYRDLVARLNCISEVDKARMAIKSLLGSVRMVPEQGHLFAEIASSEFNDALAIKVVAGTRYDHYRQAPASREDRIIRIDCSV